MKIELFGISPAGGVEYLGTFVKEEQVQRALDEYAGLGYKRLNYCQSVNR